MTYRNQYDQAAYLNPFNRAKPLAGSQPARAQKPPRQPPRPRYNKTCKACSGRFVGSHGKAYCSDNCKTTAQQAKLAAKVPKNTYLQDDLVCTMQIKSKKYGRFHILLDHASLDLVKPYTWHINRSPKPQANGQYRWNCLGEIGAKTKVMLSRVILPSEFSV